MALGKLRAEFLRLRVVRGLKENPEDEWRRMFTGLPKLDPGRSYPALDESGKCAECAELREMCDLWPVDGKLAIRKVRPGSIPPNLPDEFWASSPVLQHIREAAHSRCVSPDAVLGILLARRSAMAPVKLHCDAGLGPSTITLFTAVCGESESGKTEAARGYGASPKS